MPGSPSGDTPLGAFALKLRHSLEDTIFLLQKFRRASLLCNLSIGKHHDLIFILIVSSLKRNFDLAYQRKTASLLLIFFPTIAKSFPRIEYFFISSL